MVNLAVFLHHIRHARAGYHEDARGFGLLQVMLLDPRSQFAHELLLELLFIVDLFFRRHVQPLGFFLRKPQFQEQICARFGHMADFGIDLQGLRLLALTMV